MFWIGSIAGFVIGLLAPQVYAELTRDRDPVVTVVLTGIGTDELLTATRKSGAVEKYRGGSTVWHEYPSGQRLERERERWCTKTALRLIWEHQAGVHSAPHTPKFHQEKPLARILTAGCAPADLAANGSWFEGKACAGGQHGVNRL